MISFFKKIKFPTALFVVASLIALLVAAFFYFIFNFLFLASNTDVGVKDDEVNYVLSQNNFSKSDISDPFITKKPGIKDLIKEPIRDGSDPVLGNKDAKVSLIIFSDFSCSFCANQERILKEVVNKYGNQINLIWKDYPLNNLESESFSSARAARCAQEQDKFWDYHDLLFENQDQRKESDFISFAQDSGLDKNKFISCLELKKVDQKIERNMSEANALEIYGIPFIYINDLEIVGEINEVELSKIIEAGLED